MDNVNHPSHYAEQGAIECIEVLEQLAKDGHDFRILNAMKYLWRYRNKNKSEDLKKAIWYIQRTLNENEENAGRDAADRSGGVAGHRGRNGHTGVGAAGAASRRKNTGGKS